MRKIYLLFVLIFVAFSCGKHRDFTGLNITENTGELGVKLIWQGNENTLKYAAPAGVQTIKIAISSYNMTPRLASFLASAGSGTVGKVPAGSGRTVVALGQDANGKTLYSGEVNDVVISAGKTTTVTISMTAVTPGSYVFYYRFGAKGTGDGYFSSPYGIARDTSGNLYITDMGNNRVQKFTSEGKFILKWGTICAVDTNNDKIADRECNGNFCDPLGIATDTSGNVYVVDNCNWRVQKFSSTGAYIAKWGSYGSGAGKFWSPFFVTTDSSGNIYVTDYNDGKVQKFTSGGAYITYWNVYYPCGIVTDTSGNIYVGTGVLERIEKYTSTGTWLMQWGSSGTGNGQFRSIRGIATDSSNNVFVADAENDRIQKFTHEGVYLTKFGSRCREDTNDDGIPDKNCNGKFYYPTDLKVDSQGYVYVVDMGNHRVQVFAGR